MKAVVAEADAEIDGHPIQERRYREIAPTKAKQSCNGAKVEDNQHNEGNGVQIATIVFVSLVSLWKGVLVDHCWSCSSLADFPRNASSQADGWNRAGPSDQAKNERPAGRSPTENLKPKTRSIVPVVPGIARRHLKCSGQANEFKAVAGANVGRPARSAFSLTSAGNCSAPRTLSPIPKTGHPGRSRSTRQASGFNHLLSPVDRTFGCC